MNRMMAPTQTHAIRPEGMMRRKMGARRILIAVSTFPWDIGERCRDAFRQMGHDAVLWKFDMMCTRPGFRNRIVRFLKPRLKHSREIVQRYDAFTSNLELLRQVRSLRPDLVFVIDGKIFTRGTLDRIRDSGARSANWFTDDPFDFGTSGRICTYYDHFFTHDTYIIPQYREKGQRNTHYLPFACDPDHHRRIRLTDSEKNDFASDVVFIGSIGRQRRELFEQLAELPVDFRLWGDLEPFEGDSPIQSHFMGKARGAGMVAIFNAAKIALNVHVGFNEGIERSGYGTNMRLFDLAGCGVFQLVDHKKDIENLFAVGDEIVCYENVRDLKEKILHYLRDEGERVRIARNMQKRAYRDHTYLNRMKQVIDTVGIS
jgi:spore maturation protein CgeB